MNNKRVQSYLFVPASEKKNLIKSSQLVENGETVRIIDLEDSIKDATSLEHSDALKDEARKLLLEYLPTDKHNFHLRINDLRSSFWEKDMKMLSDLSGKIDLNKLLKGIVLPKADSDDEIKRLIKLLEDQNIKVPVIPIIETLNGMKNLNEITRNNNVESVMFGHHDYFYEKNNFPIPNTALTSNLYRETLQKMIFSLKGSGVGLIDGICPHLHNKEAMQDSCRYLYQQAPELRLGKLALNPQQVEAINTTDDWNKELDLTSEDDETSRQKRKEIAKEIIKNYEGRGKTNLGVGRAEGEYISPQQYYLALDVIQEDEEKGKELKFR